MSNSQPKITTMDNDTNSWALIGKSSSSSNSGSLNQGAHYVGANLSESLSLQIPRDKDDGGNIMLVGTSAGTWQMYCSQGSDTSTWDVYASLNEGKASNLGTFKKNVNVELEIRSDSLVLTQKT